MDGRSNSLWLGLLHERNPLFAHLSDYFALRPIPDKDSVIVRGRWFTFIGLRKAEAVPTRKNFEFSKSHER